MNILFGAIGYYKILKYEIVAHFLDKAGEVSNRAKKLLD